MPVVLLASCVYNAGSELKVLGQAGKHLVLTEAGCIISCWHTTVFVGRPLRPVCCGDLSSARLSTSFCDMVAYAHNLIHVELQWRIHWQTD